MAELWISIGWDGPYEGMELDEVIVGYGSTKEEAIQNMWDNLKEGCPEDKEFTSWECQARRVK